MSSELSAAARPRKARGMAWQRIDGETVLLNVDGRELMGVNATGARIWELVDGKRTVGELAKTIAAEFTVPPDTAARDVHAFLAELLDRGVIEV